MVPESAADITLTSVKRPPPASTAKSK